MQRRLIAAAMALAVSTLAAQPLLAAPLRAFHAPVHAKIGTQKPVKFNMRNDSKEPVTVKAGDQEIPLEPGKMTEVKLQEGLQITTLTATATHAAGTVLATVDRTLSGNTLVVR
jgi:hypothetical protein